MIDGPRIDGGIEALTADGLTVELATRIKTEGPIGVDDFMAAALTHPRWGYYMRKDPFGVDGDFVTAPEITQLFGEMIGVWAVLTWQSMGGPDPFILAELGPGRGTLMVDLLRAAASVTAFGQAARIHLVESSPVLRQRQRGALADRVVTWHADVSSLPSGPLIAIANEFFDALPIRQFVSRRGRWHERRIGLRADRFVFMEGPPTDVALPSLDARDGDIFEICESARLIAESMGARLCAEGGALMAIDYGHARSAVGETLQAVQRHCPVPPLANPGAADLTAHVDFQALGEAARPARTTPAVAQRDFLGSLAIRQRAERLMMANPERAEDIAAGCRRLIDERGMGTLFKAMVIAHPDLPSLPGF